jgi:hypothetical protein
MAAFNKYQRIQDNKRLFMSWYKTCIDSPFRKSDRYKNSDIDIMLNTGIMSDIVVSICCNSLCIGKDELMEVLEYESILTENGHIIRIN